MHCPLRSSLDIFLYGLILENLLVQIDMILRGGDRVTEGVCVSVLAGVWRLITVLSWWLIQKGNNTRRPTRSSPHHFSHCRTLALQSVESAVPGCKILKVDIVFCQMSVSASAKLIRLLVVVVALMIMIYLGPISRPAIWSVTDTDRYHLCLQHRENWG